jgi:spore coat assembly protein
MNFKKGDYVTRNSYHNDITFKIINIEGNICYLKGIDVRLYADSEISDLVLANNNNADNFEENIEELRPLDRDSYFYMPAKILHLDGDKDYLTRCLNLYKKYNLKAVGKVVKEEELALKISKLLTEYNPDIVIITGHDAYYKRRGSTNDLNNYQNSKYFCEAVINARRYEKNNEKLIIIAGACQSDYEELLKCGANFASSPKRINIHALDPAIIAVTIALTEKNQAIDLIDLLHKTKYGPDGIGGIKCMGLMFVGYPR